jgi:hypothetical protein
LNSAVAEAAAAVVDDVLPVQECLGELLGFPMSEPALARLQERRRAGGRPAGARNKRLDEIARQVRERFGDPLLRQVAIATMPLEDLLALGLKPAEALAEQRLSAATVLPYLEQKQPVRVDVTGRQVVYLTIGAVAEEGEENQGVVEAFAVELDSAELDGARKALMSQAVSAGAQLMADQACDAPAAPLAPAPEGATPPGGGDFGRVALSLAPATVVSPMRRISPPTRNRAGAEPGAGGTEG